MSRQDDEIVDEGPWGVYDEYCLSCSSRAVAAAPVQAEAIDLWECFNCGEMTMARTPASDGE
jgi:hypothetical protein